MSLEKRQFKRFDTFLIAEFRPFKTTHEYSIGVTSNFSHEGFCFESQSLNANPTEILEVKLKHPHSDLSVPVLGEIVWIKETWYTRKIGIKFSEIEQASKDRLLELLSKDRKHTELIIHGKASPKKQLT